jgi:hypothetical protein
MAIIHRVCSAWDGGPLTPRVLAFENIRVSGDDGSSVRGKMPRKRLERIRDCIRLRRYSMSAHAMEEMAEDLLDIVDVEAAILSGRVRRMERGDPRGVRYVVVGWADDRRTPVGVVGRFVEESQFLIVTVYVAD